MISAEQNFDGELLDAITPGVRSNAIFAGALARVAHSPTLVVYAEGP